MKNKKTTIAGYLLVAGSVLTLIAQVLSGTPISEELVAGILGGLGLVAASDGGH